MILKSALMCLALTVHFESRGEPIKGQYAVAEVVMNRAEKRNLTVCQVVKQKGQFSWLPKWNRKLPTHNKHWEQSVSIAETVLKGKVTNYTKGSSYFRHKSGLNRSIMVSPIIIGNHVFYKHK